jgi:hypothetical protein
MRGELLERSAKNFEVSMVRVGNTFNLQIEVLDENLVSEIP